VPFLFPRGPAIVIVIVTVDVKKLAIESNQVQLVAHCSLARLTQVLALSGKL
jgi:hypothetical protein